MELHLPDALLVKGKACTTDSNNQCGCHTLAILYKFLPITIKMMVAAEIGITAFEAITRTGEVQNTCNCKHHCILSSDVAHRTENHI